MPFEKLPFDRRKEEMEAQIIQSAHLLIATRKEMKHFLRVSRMSPYECSRKSHSLPNPPNKTSCVKTNQVPVSSRKISVRSMKRPSIRDELNRLIKLTHDTKQLMEKCNKHETNTDVPYDRDLSMPLPTQSYNTILERVKDAVPIPSNGLSLRTLRKQYEIKFPDFASAFDQIIPQESGSRGTDASRPYHCNASHQTGFIVNGVGNPPDSLQPFNDGEVLELCDTFADVMSTESSRDTKM